MTTTHQVAIMDAASGILYVHTFIVAGPDLEEAVREYIEEKGGRMKDCDWLEITKIDIDL